MKVLCIIGAARMALHRMGDSKVVQFDEGSAEVASPAFSWDGTTMYGDGRGLGDNARGGNDILISGSGSDHMYGDADPQQISSSARTGSDVFVFIHGSIRPQTSDFIGDFEPGKDKIEFRDFGKLKFEDLNIQGNSIFFADTGSYIYVSSGRTEVNTTLSKSDFLFT